MFSTVINLRYSRVSKEVPPAWKLKLVYFRSSRPEYSVKEVFLVASQNLQEKHLCQRLFFNKVVDLRPATLLKKRLWHRCFPENFAKYLRTPSLFNRKLLVAASSIPREIRRTLTQPMSNWNFSHLKRN